MLLETKPRAFNRGVGVCNNNAVAAYFRARITLVFDTRQRIAISRKLNSCPRSSRISVTETETRGLPNRLPLARALRRPALTRSTIIERSSSATAASTVKIILPIRVATERIRLKLIAVLQVPEQVLLGFAEVGRHRPCL